MLEVKVKKLIPEAVIPQYALSGDAGLDLVATSISYEHEEGNFVYGTGLAFEIPEGYVGLLFPRSSNSKKELLLSNSVGVIDSNYRGEVMIKFKPVFKIDTIARMILELGIFISEKQNDIQQSSKYQIGDKVGQLIILPYPQIKLLESEELSSTNRGDNGFGSTGV